MIFSAPPAHQADGKDGPPFSILLKRLVRPAGIEPATLSLEDRFGRAVHNKFKAFGVQDAAESDRSPLSHAPPAHHLFTLRDPYANLTVGHRETLGQRATATRLDRPARRIVALIRDDTVFPNSLRSVFQMER